MPGPSLIAGYLAELSAQLPAPVVEELADGLDQTRQHYLSQGMDREEAARAALGEFGEAHVIVAAFTRLSAAHRAARRLLVTGPVVGACWATALITGRAWTWPVPAVARLLVAGVLIGVIDLLIAAAFGRHYRAVNRAGTAACLGLTVLDTTLLITAATLATPTLIWPAIPALAASTARLTYTARALRPILAL